MGAPAAEVARRIGRSPSWVSKHLKVLELPKEILGAAESRKLGYEALYAIAAIDVPPHERARLLDIAATEGRPALHRAVEALATEAAQRDPAKRHARSASLTRRPIASRAVRSAAARTLAAVKHLDTLLSAAKGPTDTGALRHATAVLCTALERFLTS
jgi:hypothetical protein